MTEDISKIRDNSCKGKDSDVSNIPAKCELKKNYKFIDKLGEMLVCPRISNVISWNEAGDTIEIKDEKRMVSEVLPYYFKHRSISNFVRQLNMYNFKKVKHYPNLAVYAYSNPLFKRDSIDSKIIRKNSVYPITSELLSHEAQRLPRTDLASDLLGNPNTLELVLNGPFFSKRVNLLLRKLRTLESKISNLERTNDTIIENNNDFSEHLLIKTDHIKRLESIVFWMIQNFLQRNNLRENFKQPHNLLSIQQQASKAIGSAEEETQTAKSLCLNEIITASLPIHPKRLKLRLIKSKRPLFKTYKKSRRRQLSQISKELYTNLKSQKDTQDLALKRNVGESEAFFRHILKEFELDFSSSQKIERNPYILNTNLSQGLQSNIIFEDTIDEFNYSHHLNHIDMGKAN